MGVQTVERTKSAVPACSARRPAAGCRHPGSGLPISRPPTALRSSLVQVGLVAFALVIIGRAAKVQLFDHGEWTEHDAGLRSTDPLKFVVSTSGNPWLSTSIVSGQTPAPLTINVKPAGLGNGTEQTLLTL